MTLPAASSCTPWGWIGLAAVLLLGARSNRYRRDGAMSARIRRPASPSSRWAPGSLAVGLVRFQRDERTDPGQDLGLVAVNSLMAMVGGTLAATLMGRNDPGFAYNGPLAGLVAVCAGSDLMHPLGAAVTGAVAGVLFVKFFTWTQNRVAHRRCAGCLAAARLCGAWGGLACGIFGQTALGGIGGVSFAQLLGTVLGVAWAFVGGLVVYGLLKQLIGLRLSQEEEFEGADLAIHKISASPDNEGWLVTSARPPAHEGPAEALVSVQESRSCSPASCRASPRSNPSRPARACTRCGSSCPRALTPTRHRRQRRL